MGLFVPALILLFVLALIFQYSPLFTLLWFLLGIYVLARIWTRRAQRNVRIERVFADRAFTGDALPVTLTVTNRGILPVPWLELAESVPVDLRDTPPPTSAITLGAHARQTFPYMLRCRRRGLYHLGPLHLESGDLLGIERDLLLDPPSPPLIVYPRIVPLASLQLPTRSALTTLPARLPLFEDPTRLLGVRDYRPGDSPRKIHWTASARTQRLVVKQWQPAVSRDTLLCLDLDPRSYERGERGWAVEQAIIVAASLAHHMMVQERVPAGLATVARDAADDTVHRFVLPPRTGREHLTGILEILARVNLGPGPGFAAILCDESTRLPWGSTVVAITGAVEEDLVATLLGLQRRGHAVAVIVVQPQVAGIALAGIPVHRVWLDTDLGALA